MRFLWRSVRREKWEVCDVAVSCGTPKLQPCPPRNWEPEAQPPSSQRNLRSSLLSGIFLNRSWLTDSTRSWSLLPVSVYVTTSLCCPGVFVMFTAMSLEHSPGKAIEGKKQNHTQIFILDRMRVFLLVVWLDCCIIFFSKSVSGEWVGGDWLKWWGLGLDW